MISRILVPKDARLPAAESGAPPRRLSSELDVRALVPANLPHIELDPRTSIPSYLPLEVLGHRLVVPRDMPHTPLDVTPRTPSYVPLTILDSRVAVPKDAHISAFAPKPLVLIQDLPGVLDPDVFTTGEVVLMPKPVEEGTSAWNGAARVASIGFHFILILLVFMEPKFLPDRQNPRDEIARDNLNMLYLPPNVRDVPKVQPPPQTASPRIRIDPRILQKLAPPREPQPLPGPPEPERVVRDAPQPAPEKLTQPPPPSRTQQPPQDSIFKPVPQPPQQSSGLVLPRFSPGKALQESLHEALKEGGSPSAQFGGPAPSAPSPGGGGGLSGGGGGGQGYLGGTVDLLTPTEGVDFSNYLARVLASVKRNWYAVMPESAQLGDKGVVVLQFRIQHNGVVPENEPALLGSSGKEPLDRAAVSAIRASTPFDQLPPAFSGPYIELRFRFLYNLPLDYQ
jgi:TonB family protein